MGGETIESCVEHRAVSLHPEEVRFILERVAVIKGDKDHRRRRRLLLVLVAGGRLACQTD